MIKISSHAMSAFYLSQKRMQEHFMNNLNEH